ncbi:MAG: RNA polymerase sigma factor [Candidatus Limnocylindrales bacterium]
MLGLLVLERDRRPTMRGDDADARTGDPVAPERAATRATPDEAAALFEEYSHRIRRYIAFRVRGPEDADDLTADVFRRVLSAPIPAEPSVRPAWLFRVAHNAIVDHYRQRRFNISLGSLPDRADDAPGLPEAAIRDEQLRAIDGALAALAGRQRAAIYLRFHEGLSYAEIATIMGLPAVSARTLVHRGLRRVSAALAEKER